MAEKKSNQVNVDFSRDLDLLADLDQMVQADESDRSKFIRKLVRQEKVRREALQTQPVSTIKKNRTSTQALAV